MSDSETSVAEDGAVSPQGKLGDFWSDPPRNVAQQREHELSLKDRDIEHAALLVRAKEAEVRSNVVSLEKEKVRAGISADQNNDDIAPRQLLGRSMADVQMRAIDWLWTGCHRSA